MHPDSMCARALVRTRRSAAVLVAALAFAVPAAAAEGDANSGGDRIARDLFSVLALRGKPCGRVVETQKQAEQDYLVRCEDGHRYRIRIEGDRVVIEAR